MKRLHPDESVDFYRPKGSKSKRRKLGKGSKGKKRGPINDATYEYNAERLEIPEAAEIPKASNPYRQVANPFSFNVSQVGMIPYPIYDPEMYGWAAFRKIGGITLEARGGGGGGGKNKRSLQDKSAEGTKAIEGVEEPSEAPSHQVLTKRGRAKRVFGDIPYEIGLHTDRHREGYKEFVPDKYVEHRAIGRKEAKEKQAIRHEMEGYFEGKEFDKDLARADSRRNDELEDRRDLMEERRTPSTKDLIRERRQLRKRKEVDRLKDLEKDLKEFRQYEKDVEVGSGARRADKAIAKAKKLSAINAEINALLKDDKKKPKKMNFNKPLPKLPTGRQIKVEGRGPRAPFPGPTTPKKPVEIKKEPAPTPSPRRPVEKVDIKKPDGSTYQINKSFKLPNTIAKAAAAQKGYLTNHDIKQKASVLNAAWRDVLKRKRTPEYRMKWIKNNLHAAPDIVRTYFDKDYFEPLYKTLSPKERKVVNKYISISSAKRIEDQRRHTKQSIKTRRAKGIVRRTPGESYSGKRRSKKKEAKEK